MNADDLRAGLVRAADGVVPPGDPVGRVRARVEQRRRRRTSARVAAASAAAVAVLVTGVVVAPDRLTPEVVPPAGAPTTAVEGTGPLLTPDGLPGLALGDPAPETEDGSVRGSASGCEAVNGFQLSDDVIRDSVGLATELTVWSRDGQVVALVMAVYPDRVELPGDVPRTWLGPTLRDPMAGALELAGSELVSDDPLGAEGPAISSVVLPLADGAEVVFADPPTGGSPSEGRITLVTLRTESGRGCYLVPGEDVPQPGQGVPDQASAVELTPEGLRDVRLGGSASEAVAAGLLEPVDVEFGDPLGRSGCTTFRTADDMRVWTDGDRVVAVGSLGLGPRFVLRGDVQVESGQPGSEIGRLQGAEEAPAPVTVQGTALDLPVGPGVRARVSLLPEPVALETAGVLIDGRPRVDGILLYAGDDAVDRLCS